MSSAGIAFLISCSFSRKKIIVPVPAFSFREKDFCSLSEKKTSVPVPRKTFKIDIPVHFSHVRKLPPSFTSFWQHYTL